MKHLKLIAQLVLSLVFIQSTTAQSCTPGTATAVLDGNNVKTTLSNTGAFIFSYAQPAYQFPVNPEPLPSVNAIFGASLWLSGFDPAGNLKLSAPTYGAALGTADFWPGPIESSISTTTSETCNNWDRMFKVSKINIDAHIADFNDNGIIDNVIPNDVLLWPGQNNVHAEDAFDITLDELNTFAPYVDVNGDNQYQPEDGDYPDVLGATTAVWWVVNNIGNVSLESQGYPHRFQVNYLAYSYESNEEAINNTTFYKVKLIQRDIEDLFDMFASLWIDPNLGCYTDDYIGSVPEENIAFVYNADPVDGDDGCACAGGVNTYCEEPPIIAIKMLDGLYNDELAEQTGMSSFMYYNNAAINNPPPGTTDPAIEIDYYNYMSGKWRDGTPLTYGGNGYNPGSSDLTSYAYSGVSAQGDWSMCLNDEIPGDKRMVISTGPTVMEPSTVKDFTFAIIGIPNEAGPCDGSTASIISASNAIDDFHNTVVSTQAVFVDNHSISIAPNPMTNQAAFDFGKLSGQIEQVQLFSVDGKLVRTYASIDNELTINKNDLDSGMYFYKVTTTSNQLLSGKLMVL